MRTWAPSRLRTVARVGALFSSLVALPLLVSAPAHAEGTGSPSVGACYSITDEQAIADWWPVTQAVPCAGPHTLEITHVGPIPADVNALEFAAEQCTPQTVWRDLGVNQPVGGVIPNPLRVQIVYFAVRSAPGEWACGISGWAFHGSRPESIEQMTGAWAEQTAEQRAEWRMCSSAAGGRAATAAPVTVPCSTAPRWQVTRWIQWDEVVRAYPGRTALQARARRLCGPGTVFAVPTSRQWQAGRHSTLCLHKYT